MLLFGVLAGDYFAVRRRYDVSELFHSGGAYWYWNGLHWPGLAAWAVGVIGYLWIAGKLAWLGLAGLPGLGASVPSFLLALGAYWALARILPSPVAVLSGR
ncbi:MAG: cytosine permease [Candidatus Rokubacteria bacterium]|nr:cytosine permease [Candidatus Rokubacteria bacterium]